MFCDTLIISKKPSSLRSSRDIGNAGRDRLRRQHVADLTSVQPYLPAAEVAFGVTHDDFGHFAASGADKPGDTGDLAWKYRERHVVDHVAHADVLHAQHRPRGSRPRRAARGDGASTSRSSPIMWRMRRSRSNSPAGPVFTSWPLRRTVMRSAWVRASSSACEMKIIATPRLLQRGHQLEQMIGLLGRQRRRRLVEDDDPGVVEDGAGDLDHLPFGGRQGACELRRIDVEIETLKHLPRRVSYLADRIERALASEDHVLRHGQLRNEARLLVHHRNAVARGIFRGRQDGGLLRR